MKQQSLSIGIISVYRAQARLLQILFQKEKEQDEDFRSLLATIKVDIGTVDAFQGQDLDIILLSLVLNRRDRDLSSFLADPRRINVAMSRARRLLLIFGSKHNYVDIPGSSQEFYRNIYNIACQLGTAVPAANLKKTYARYLSLIYSAD